MKTATTASDSKQRWRLALAGVAILTLMILALNLNGGGARAAEGLRQPTSANAALSNANIADLEDAFWGCDHAATTGSAAADVGTCSAVYDALKERKFGGDFAELLRWWQQHKVARHAKLTEVHHRTVAERARTASTKSSSASYR